MTPNSFRVIPAGRGFQTTGRPPGLDRLELRHIRQRFRTVYYNSEDLRLKAEIAGLQQDVAMLREEIRIKDARLARVDSRKRPHFAPADRMAVLELRAARCWSLPQTADVFQISAATVASWHKRLDEVYHVLPRAKEQPRIEPRACWPARSTYAPSRARRLTASRESSSST